MSDIVSQYPGMIRSRLRTANFGARYLGLTTDHPAVKDLLQSVKPTGIVGKWADAVRGGKIVAAEGQFETCGRGLWLAGNGGGAIAASVVQDLIISSTIESALYVRTEEFLQSERPEGSRQYRDKAMSDVLILSGYGTERKTEWAEATLDDLIVSRFDRGLPTIVTSLVKHPDSFCGYLGTEIFWSAAIMEATRGKD